MWLKIAVGTLILAGQSAIAQQTIQQPVVGVTSVNTTVSVPNRGSTFLGGVSSAQSGRSQYGPLPTGPANGYSRQATSMSVSVYIHDLQAMDEALLNSASAPSDARRPRTGMASMNAVRETEKEVVVTPAEKALKSEQLARKAEQAGKAGVAKLHWQMAVKYGSKAAEERLAEWAKPLPSRSPRTAAR